MNVRTAIDGIVDTFNPVRTLDDFISRAESRDICQVAISVAQYNKLGHRPASYAHVYAGGTLGVDLQHHISEKPKEYVETPYGEMIAMAQVHRLALLDAVSAAMRLENRGIGVKICGAASWQANNAIQQYKKIIDDLQAKQNGYMPDSSARPSVQQGQLIEERGRF